MNRTELRLKFLKERRGKMAVSKYKRVTIGSVVKSQDASKADYIKINPKIKDDLIDALQNMDEEKGLYLNLESKQSQLESIERAVENGTLTEENAAASRERVEKMPDFVRFNIVLVRK
jgi:hypothetical protein